MSSTRRVVHTRWGAASDAGGRRRVNEDAVLAEPPVFCVADGMGGHARGAMASDAVVTAFGELASRLRRDGEQADVTPEQVEAAVDAAQRRIRSGLGLTEPESGEEITAGSTLAGAVLTRSEGRASWLVFNIGDSRVYRWSRGVLNQISVDHSVVQEMVDAGAIDVEAARNHPHRNIITRAVGSGATVRPDFWVLTARRGDRLLLCSDGLVDEVTESQIADALGSGDPADAVVRRLLDRATADGGARDNVSLVVVEADLPAEPDDATAPRDLGAYDPEDTIPRAYAR
jgi:PPM family protein phosphatase